MKNPKKPGKPYNPTPKPTAKPPAVAGGVGSLPSEQWFSESTVFAVASQAADSPSASASDTGGPPDPDPCKGKIFKHSDPLPTELPIHHAQTPEEMGGKPGAPGCSDWLNKPYPPTIDTMCDGKAKVWRAFVKDCSFQLQVYIGKAKHRIFVEKIQEETDCAKLLLMLNDLKTLAADAGDNPAHADLRQPFDGALCGGEPQ